MKDVAKSTNELKLIFKGSAKELASAIVTVKGLGLELSDVEATADHLLDIETSVTKQVQAQILTGKRINLDKARQLAFNNDLVGVTGELVKQGITYKDLTEGNRIGNKLLAESLGMSLETLSKMVLEQEKFKELGFSKLRVNGDIYDLQDENIKRNPLALAPILAHYNYWHDQAIKFQAASRQARSEQSTYDEKYPGENQRTMSSNISKIRLNSIACHEQSLIAKTNAAFYLGILRNPGFSKEVSKIMEFGTTLDIGGDSERSRIILGERALASQFLPSEDYFIKLYHSDKSEETLTRREVLRLSEAKLSEKLFA
jgi:hypothetical protein